LNSSIFIGTRYVFSRNKNSAINIISLLSTGAIIVASISLFVVLSVFSGLKELSLSYTNQADPDLIIGPKKGKKILLDKKLNQLISNKNIESFSFTISEKALLRYKGKDVIVDIKGVDSQFLKVNAYEKSIQLGHWLYSGSSGAVVGSGIANKLSLALQDQDNALEVMVPKSGEINQMRIDQAFLSEYLMAVGVFSNTEEANANFAFIDINLAKDLLGFKENEVSSISLKAYSAKDLAQIKKILEKESNDNYEIKTRLELNESLHKMLNTENLVLYLIFLLIIFMVMFTLYGTLLMTIIDKKNNIKTLFNLGRPIKNIRLIFFIQGLAICFFGVVFGIFIGTIISGFQNKFNVIMINDYIPYPIVFEWQNVAVVFLTVLTIGGLMTFLASQRINKNFIKL
jgi:lipoprotein-releasing system permease protein